MKVIYCVDKQSKKKVSLPVSVTKISSVKSLPKENHSLIIVDEDFLKKRGNKKIPQLVGLVCLVYFHQPRKDGFKFSLRKGFFGCLIGSDSKETNLLKIQRAQSHLESRERIRNLERELHSKDKRIGKIVLLDPLANCYNWRYFLHRAQQEIGRARRGHHHVSFIALDIDYFRQINEVYSSRVADEVIKEFVDFVKKQLKKEYILARWREDSFFIMLPSVARKSAYKLAQKLHHKIFAHKFKYRKLRLNLKVSMGVVAYPEDSVLNTRDVINALNKCLVFAKQGGGDTVVRYSKPPSKKEISEVKSANVEELKGKSKSFTVLSLEIF